MWLTVEHTVSFDGQRSTLLGITYINMSVDQSRKDVRRINNIDITVIIYHSTGKGNININSSVLNPFTVPS